MTISNHTEMSQAQKDFDERLAAAKKRQEEKALERMRLDHDYGIRSGKLRTVGDLQELLTSLSPDMPVHTLGGDGPNITVCDEPHYRYSRNRMGAARIANFGACNDDNYSPSEFPNGLLMLFS